MSNVLTLIANPLARNLDDSTIAGAREALATAGATVSDNTRWLAPAIACDVEFTGGDVQAAVEAQLSGARIDVVTQAVEGRRKLLLVSDMESTVVTNEFIDEVAEAAGVGARVAAITARTMAGEIEFATSLKERVAMLAGLPVAALERAFETMTAMPGARALIATMTAHGAHTALVSGGFTAFSAGVRTALGFDSHYANRLEVAAHHLTGTLELPIIDRAGKLARLDALCRELKINRDQAMAVGDGANDIDMLEAAGMGVAFHAEPVVARVARVRINHGDLTALLYMQGYHARDIRSG
ncbi:MAG: phosphoserine phosphatase SerB [Alphaproteobacteria bacterium]